MDATAVNYDSKATVNSGTWCIPPVEGCMAPSVPYKSASYANSAQTESNIFTETVDVPTAGFATTTTKHVVSMCSRGRYGCMTAGSKNYDADATISTACYNDIPGCLHPQAVNYGCPTWGFNGPCSLASTEAVTSHVPATCKWSLTPAPPSPPPPPMPPAGTVEVKHKVELALTVLGGEPSEPVKDTMKTTFRTMSGVAEDKSVELTTTTTTTRRLAETRRRLAETTEITMSVEVEDAAAADAAAAAVSTAVGDSPSSASAAFASAGLEVLSAPKVETKTEFIEIDDSAATGGLIGGIVGGIGGFLMLIGIFAFIWKKKKSQKPVYPA